MHGSRRWTQPGVVHEARTCLQAQVPAFWPALHTTVRGRWGVAHDCRVGATPDTLDPAQAWLGVDCLRLPPFYPSPWRDGGYDVADFANVDPAVGTVADFSALLADAHDLGTKVIVDFVLNHTSDAHP